jgi:perosamine synthetase
MFPTASSKRIAASMPEALSAQPRSLEIPLCEPCLGGREWDYVRECLDSGWVSSVGQYVTRFEEAVAARLDARYAVATASGTAALHTALRVVGVAKDDEVLVSTLSFIAPANAIRYLGAWPTFIDAESQFWQMDVHKLAEFLARDCVRTVSGLQNPRTGRRIAAILPVHLLGHPVDMDAVMELADEYGLAVVEDATESLGATYRGQHVGKPAHIACLSFNGNKIITCGGGGMIVTDNNTWAHHAKYLTTQAKDEGVEYVHQEVGYNYRLTNLQAALGVAQFERLDGHVHAKRRIAQRYIAELGTVPGLTCMQEAPWANSAFWMFTVLVDPGTFGMSSRELLTGLRRAGIQSRPLWQPLHRSPAHAGAHAIDCRVSEHLYKHGLSLPCSVGLSPESQDVVIAAIRCAGAGTISAREVRVEI